MRIHSGTLDYLVRLHKELGIWRYKMTVLRRWPDRRYTVLFEEKEDEKAEA